MKTQMAVSRLLAVVTTLLLSWSTAPAQAMDPTLAEILRIQDESARGSSSVGTMTMRIKTAQWERTLTLKTWSQGTNKTLVRIEAPAKEKGTATLKVDGDIWNYLPKVDRTIKVPGSMMSASWMGSHFSNDDLVRESRFTDHFTCQFLQKADPAAGRHHHVVECTPRPTAPVVWGKVQLRVRAEDKLADQVTYYDEKGALVRTMTFSGFDVVGGRKMARRMQLTVADRPNELTEIHYDEITFDVKHPEQTFTLQALKR
ncbi:MAG: outer membrane lipoprotein-sorting protein [Myxococcota bacterium]